jgi:Uma2 family endonuclease
MQTLTYPLKIEKEIIKYSWKNASWNVYLETVNSSIIDNKVKLYFYQNQLLIDMGKEGINHSSICNLFIMLFAFWANQHPEENYSSYGGCLLENHQLNIAAAPDLVLYLGENYPKWERGERRFLDVEKWGVPNLVGEISDTTLATDLDEKKHLYASLKIPEYWVVDILAKRVFCFLLQENNIYQESDFSLVLKNLPISLLDKAITRLDIENNGKVASWFAQQIIQIK